MSRIVATIVIVTSFVSVAAASTGGVELPVNLRSMLEKSASFALDRYPIGFWSYTNLTEHGKYMDEAEIEEWADAGFTVTLSPSFEPRKSGRVKHIRKLLDWADKRGMKLILRDPRAYGPHHMKREEVVSVPEDYPDRIAGAIKDFGDHPAVFGFQIGDEPCKYNNDGYFSAYRTLKKAAPQLHPFMNLLPWYPGVEDRVGYASWPEYLDAVVEKANVDFLCYDCYFQMAGNIELYFENLRLFREAAWRNAVPFWTTILSVGHFYYRCPNSDELRWQFNTAICSGANGILWFFYYMRAPHSNYRLPPVDENWERTQTYYDIRRFQKAFHRFYGDLFLGLAPTRVTFYPAALGGGEVFSPNELVSDIETDKEGHPLLLGEFVDIQGRRYVMLVNNSMTDSIRAGLTFPGKDVKTYSWNWKGQEHEGKAYDADGKAERTDSGVRIWHWLAPGQEAVYRVDSELVRNAKIELKGTVEQKSGFRSE